MSQSFNDEDPEGENVQESLADRLDKIELKPGMEPLTPEEKEAFLARARARGRSLTSEEQYAIFGPAPETTTAPVQEVEEVAEMEAAALDSGEMARLRQNFFPELGAPADLPDVSLVQGVIFDFDHTLAYLARPQDDLLAEGARNAEAYMRSTGMTLPDDFWTNIVEARRFSEEKSAEEKEEHIADDAMSFLLQFFGYPVSKMDPVVLRQAVDIFYAPEMSAWCLYPDTLSTLQELRDVGYRLAVMTNFNCDRVFQRAIDYLGLRAYLDIALASASVEYRKPDAQIFNIVLEQWDALPYEIVVVGDSLHEDIQGGIEVGALTVLTTMGTSSQVAHDNAQLAKQIIPDATIPHLAQLPQHIYAWDQP